MKTIIAGSRTITDLSLIYEAVRLSEFNITAILSGKANGVDDIGELYGRTNKIPILEFPAKWRDEFGNFIKSAGFKRNEEMAKNAEALIAIWDGISKGTAHMISLAKRYNLKIYVVILREE